MATLTPFLYYWWDCNNFCCEPEVAVRLPILFKKSGKESDIRRASLLTHWDSVPSVRDLPTKFTTNLTDYPALHRRVFFRATEKRDAMAVAARDFVSFFLVNDCYDCCSLLICSCLFPFLGKNTWSPRTVNENVRAAQELISATFKILAGKLSGPVVIKLSRRSARL